MDFDDISVSSVKLPKNHSQRTQCTGIPTMPQRLLNISVMSTDLQLLLTAFTMSQN